MSTQAGKAGKAGNAGKLENEPFSESGWKSCKIIGFPLSLAGKTGILFVDLITINTTIR